MQTIPELLKNYQPNPSASYSTRVADLLLFVAKEMPGTYIPRKYIARVAFALPRLPADDSEHCGSKLSKVIAGADRIMFRSTNNRVQIDRFLGVRATYSEDDKAAGPLEGKHRRAHHAIKGLKSMLDAIDRSKLSPEKRKRFNAIANGQSALLQGYIEKVPLLLTNNTDPEKESEKK